MRAPTLAELRGPRQAEKAALRYKKVADKARVASTERVTISDSSRFQTLRLFGILGLLVVPMGYLLPAPTGLRSIGLVGLAVVGLCGPFLIRSHHTLLFLGRNAKALFFLPGRRGGEKLFEAISPTAENLAPTDHPQSQRFVSQARPPTEVRTHWPGTGEKPHEIEANQLKLLLKAAASESQPFLR
jgi:hypothetical protein